MVTDSPPVFITQTSTESELKGQVETHKPPTTTADTWSVEQNVTQLPLSSPPSIIDDLIKVVTAQPEIGSEIPEENATSLTGKKENNNTEIWCISNSPSL